MQLSQANLPRNHRSLLPDSLLAVPLALVGTPRSGSYARGPRFSIPRLSFSDLNFLTALTLISSPLPRITGGIELSSNLKILKY